MRRSCSIFLVAAVVTCWAQSTFATQWHNYNQPGVVMDDVLSPTNRMYDGWGSWYDDGTGMKFHGTAITAGNNHPTDPPGHGFINPSGPILYQYESSFFNNAPAGAKDIIENAFDMWEQEVSGTVGVVRNPYATLGFGWAPADVGDAFQIEIDWQHQAGTAAGWVDGYPNNASFAIPTLHLTFVDEYWSNAAGGWVATNFDFDTGMVPPDPGPLGDWPHPYDFFSTALHELGHLAGLDDLYNLDGTYGGYEPKAFPGSTMGTPCVFGQNAAHACVADPANLVNAYNPYHRLIDLGSIQGVIDLYTVPEPASLGLAMLALLVLFWIVESKRSVFCHSKSARNIERQSQILWRHAQLEIRNVVARCHPHSAT